MKLCKIYTEIRRGRKVASREYPPRTLADVKHEIDALNGKTNTLVMLFVDQQTNLAIGGGNQERYNVEVTYGVSDAFYTLLCAEPHRDDENEIELVVGGQAAPFPATEVVDYRTALKAARYWAKHAALAPSLEWKKH